MRTGRLVWSSRAGAFGVVAGSDTLLTVTAHGEGHGGNTMAYAAVHGLVALDPATGRVRWSRPLAPDGQSVPAAVARRTVVVSEANGTVIGLATTTGRIEWTDRAPSGCPLLSSGEPGLGLNATLVRVPATGAAGPVLVDYDCSHAALHRPEDLVRINSTTGRVEWRWQEPPGWSVEYWAPAASEADVVEVLAAGPQPVAPVRDTYPGISPGSGTEDAEAINETTGRPLWQVDGIPASGGVYAGGGQLCVASQLRVDCRHAHTGGEDWQFAPAVAPAASRCPMSPTRSSTQGCSMTSSGRTQHR